MDFGCALPGRASALNRADAAPMQHCRSRATIGRAASDCVVAREGEVDFLAVRGQLRWQPDRPPRHQPDRRLHPRRPHRRRQRAARRGSSTASAGEPELHRDPNPAVPAGTSIRLSPERSRAAVDTASRLDLALPVRPVLQLRELQLAGRRPVAGRVRAPGWTKFEGWGVSRPGRVRTSRTDDIAAGLDHRLSRNYTSEFYNDNDASPLAHSLGYGHAQRSDYFSQELRLNGSFGANDELEYTRGRVLHATRSRSTRPRSGPALRSALQRSSRATRSTPTPRRCSPTSRGTPIERADAQPRASGTPNESKTYQYIRQRPYNDPTSITANGVLPLNGTIGRYKGEPLRLPRSTSSTRGTTT